MRRTLALSCALVLSVLANAGTANAGGGGQFIVNCEYHHSLHDDPIVFPEQPRASHRHDFFGNSTTDASSTHGSLTAPTAESTCTDSLDKSAYWAPSSIIQNRLRQPRSVHIYYNSGTGAAPPGVETFPAGTRMIGGDPHATGVQSMKRLYWTCGGGNKSPNASHPYNCGNDSVGCSPDPCGAFSDGVVIVMLFPQCWNGIGTQHTDYAYPDEGQGGDGGPSPVTCDGAFSHTLTKVSLHVHTGVVDPCAGLRPCGPSDSDVNVQLSLSSGAYYTAHADFFMAWDQTEVDGLVSACINALVNCGTIRDELPPGSPGRELDAPVFDAYVVDGSVDEPVGRIAARGHTAEMGCRLRTA
jgi:hypothetical protein